MLSNSADSPVDSAPGPGFFVKSTDIYLEDGNVAVVAHIVVFRVHRSQLALHSEVFKDMLSLVTEPRDGEVYDGCPVVRLTDDSKDLAVLFKVMYGQIQFKPEMVDQLISAIRLSTKYLMDPIRTSALENLAIVYPPELYEWDAYHGSRQRCVDVLKLAIEVNADILLPAAYYAMSIQTDLSIFDIDLPRPLIENFICGKGVLTKSPALFMKKNKLEHDEDLCFGENCSMHWDDIETNAISMVLNGYSGGSYIRVSDPLSGFICLLVIVEDSLCRGCKNIFEGTIHAERDIIWRNLPQTFGLGSLQPGMLHYYYMSVS